MRTSRVATPQRERGAVAVELALVLPVLVLLLWGIIEFGRGYSDRVQLTAAVRDGARAAALSSSTDPAAVLTAAQTATRNAAAGLTPGSIVVTVPTACPADPTPTDRATVQATYPFTYDIPFFRKGTITMRAQAVMRCGG